MDDCNSRLKAAGIATLASAFGLVAGPVSAITNADAASGGDLTAPANRTSAGACGATSQAMFHACAPDAQASHAIDVAKCLNVRNAKERKDCQDAARSDLEDAFALCPRQLAARQQVCKLVGPGRYDPVLDPANFSHSTKITNTYFPLVPWTTFLHKTVNPSNPSKTLEIDRFTVTERAKIILGVTCVVVHDRAFADGELIEDTFDYFAQDNDGNVWYFGEATSQLENGIVVGMEGAWQAGVDHAKPGIVMKAHPMVGDSYRQEFALGDAEDAATVKTLTASASVPYGSYDRTLLETYEYSGLEPDAKENKFFAPGVGQVLTIDRVTGDREELVHITHQTSD